jgi:hypothetical protein
MPKLIDRPIKQALMLMPIVSIEIEIERPLVRPGGGAVGIGQNTMRVPDVNPAGLIGFGQSVSGAIVYSVGLGEILKSVGVGDRELGLGGIVVVVMLLLWWWRRWRRTGMEG